MEKNNNLEKRLREAAENFEIQPSAKVWENIQANIPSDSKKVYWLKWAVAAAVLLLAGLAWYFSDTSGGQFKKDKQTLVYTDSSTDIPNGKNTKKDIFSANTGKTNAGKILAAKNDNTGISESGKTQNPGKKRDKEMLQVSGSRSLESPDRKNKTAVVLAGAGPVQKRNFESEPAEATSGLTASEKDNSLTNEFTPVQEDISVSYLSGRLSYKMETLSDFPTDRVRYSDKMMQLLLKSAGAAEPLLAKNESSDRGNKMKFGVFFTPGLSYRTLKSGVAPQGSGNMANMPVSTNSLRPAAEQTTTVRLNTQDMPLQQKQSWGWNSGARIAWSLPKNWILQTGLSIQQTGYEITAYKKSPAYLFNNNTSSLGTTPPAEGSTYSRYAEGGAAAKTNLENTYLNTELPLLIGHRFGSGGKVSFTIMGGAGLTYLLHADATIYEPHSERYFSDNDYLSRFNSSLILEANVDVPVSANLGFSIGPALQYQVFSSYKNYDPVQEYPYLVGVKTALYLK